MSLKTQAFLIVFLMTAGGFVAIGGASLGLYDATVGIGAALVCLCLGFAAVVRLKCSHCGVVLANGFPAGALILLIFAKDKCLNCGARLP